MFTRDVYVATEIVVAMRTLFSPFEFHDTTTPSIGDDGDDGDESLNVTEGIWYVHHGCQSKCS